MLVVVGGDSIVFVYGLHTGGNWDQVMPGTTLAAGLAWESLNGITSTLPILAILHWRTSSGSL